MRSKKIFILFIVFLTFIFGIFGSLSYSQPKTSPEKIFKLTLSFWGTLAEPMGKALQEYVAEVDKKTNGRVKITIHPGGSLTPGPQAYEGLVAGLSDLAFVLHAYTPGRFPLIMAWTIPFGISSAKVATEIFYESIEKFKPKEWADTKLMYFTTPTAIHFFTTKKPIKRIEDFRGMKFRTLGWMAEYIKQLGAIPISMPVSEIYSALDRGVIDGTINNLLTLKDWRFADVVKYVHLFDFPGVTSSWGLHMNWKVWNGLPPDIQQIFEEANKKYPWRQIEYQEEADKAGIELALSKGVQIIKGSPELSEEMKKRVPSVFEAYIKSMEGKGLPVREFVKFIQERVEKYPK